MWRRGGASAAATNGARVSRCCEGCESRRTPREARSGLTLVDSSGWLEYLADRPLAAAFAPYIEGRDPLLVSAIEIYEIYKIIRRDLSEVRALEAVSALRRAMVVPLDESLALDAADASLANGLAMADAIVYATARRHAATLVTADSDFEGLPGVTVIR